MLWYLFGGGAIVADMGRHNALKGGSVLDGELHACLSIRHGEEVTIGRYKSGDELVVFAPVGSLDRHLRDLIAHLSGYGIAIYQECEYDVRPTIEMLDCMSDAIDMKKPPKPVRVLTCGE
jgi:hypothetical protein